MSSLTAARVLSLLVVAALASACAPPMLPPGGHAADLGHADVITSDRNPGSCTAGEFACVAPMICGASGQCIMPGSCASTADCAAGETCGASGGVLVCQPGGCGGQKLQAEVVPPNLLIVLDRSCSMTKTVGGSTKWQIAVTALNQVVTSFTGKIRFGLTMFPDTRGDECDEGSIPLPVGAGNEAAIQSTLTAALNQNDSNFPSNPCTTPIDAAMHQASTDPGLVDPTHANYALLLTDGKQPPSCNAWGGAAGATQIISDLHQVSGVDTFVVGFGGQADPTQLDAFATAGGEAVTTGPNRFYDAADATSLETALANIASKTAASCVYQLQSAPSDPMQVFAFFDQVPVPRDTQHANGWDYDVTTDQITFYGAACTQIATVASVDIVFGCDAPPIQ